MAEILFSLADLGQIKIYLLHGDLTPAQMKFIFPQFLLQTSIMFCDLNIPLHIPEK